VYAGFAPLHQETARPDRALHLAAPIKPPERCPWSAQLTGTSRERPISRLSRAAEQGDEIPPHQRLRCTSGGPHQMRRLRALRVHFRHPAALPRTAAVGQKRPNRRTALIDDPGHLRACRFKWSKRTLRRARQRAMLKAEHQPKHRYKNRWQQCYHARHDETEREYAFAEWFSPACIAAAPQELAYPAQGIEYIGRKAIKHSADNQSQRLLDVLAGRNKMRSNPQHRTDCYHPKNGECGVIRDTSGFPPDNRVPRSFHFLAALHLLKPVTHRHRSSICALPNSLQSQSSSRRLMSALGQNPKSSKRANVVRSCPKSRRSSWPQRSRDSFPP